MNLSLQSHRTFKGKLGEAILKWVQWYWSIVLYSSNLRTLWGRGSFEQGFLRTQKTACSACKDRIVCVTKLFLVPNNVMPTKKQTIIDERILDESPLSLYTEVTKGWSMQFVGVQT
jgi:hypothetical protein